jgi:hypothetical protein
MATAKSTPDSLLFLAMCTVTKGSKLAGMAFAVSLRGFIEIVALQIIFWHS